MKFIIFLILITLLLQITHGAQINEVMYNPPGLDNNKEFIEIYLDNNESLENWIIADSSSNDTLVLLTYINSSYALIVESGYEYEISDVSYYSVGATIGNNLNNDQDSVFLYNLNHELIDSIEYDGSIANDNGFTLEYYNGSGYESTTVGGTPGEKNSIEIYFNDLIINISNQSIVNITNNSYIINNTVNDISNNSIDNVSKNNLICDINLNITSEKRIYFPDEKIKYKIDLNNKSYPYTLEYWIEDIFGNIVKNKYNTTNTNQKTWTPDCDEGYVFVLNSRLVAVECNDSNKEDNYVKEFVIVQCEKSQESAEEFKEDVEIVDTYFGTDNSVKFGEVSRVKLYLSKGNTAKTAIEMYVTNRDEKISEITKFNMNQKQSELFVTLPLMIKSNCNEKFDEGEYQLVVSGLGVDDKTSIEIIGYETDICKIKTKIVSKECEEKQCDFAVVNNNLDKKKSKINSFYTLAKKKSDNVRLFANVECLGGCILILSNDLIEIEKRKIHNFSGKIDFNVSYYNEYFLELSEINENKNLTMKFEQIKIKNNITIELNQSNETLITNIKNKNEITIEKKDLDIISGNAVNEPEVIFESVTSKSKKMIKYFFVVIFMIISGIIMWKKPFSN